jgi:LPXTG-motif cell wall-anchored protein
VAELKLRPKTGSDSLIWLWAILIVAIVGVAIWLLMR